MIGNEILRAALICKLCTLVGGVVDLLGSNIYLAYASILHQIIRLFSIQMLAFKSLSCETPLI